MADNSENILVEFDYQNIIVVDPNKIIDSDGKAKERLVNHEDLVMYANLECSVIPRTKLSIGASNSELKTVSLAKINFLNPTGGKYLNNNYTNFFTGDEKKSPLQPPNNFYDQTPIRYVGEEPENEITETSLLGITAISMRVNTSFMPTISITLEDVRGRALFELGDKSPYAAFFNLPYPTFFLTLKGYYGKAVRYRLMLQNFNASFDYNSGNFKVNLTFLTYKYTVLSEIPMGYLLAVPHMYKSDIKLKAANDSQASSIDLSPVTVEKGYEKVKELYNEYKSKGLLDNDFPELTLVQLQKKLDSFVKNILTSFGEENLTPLTDIDTYTLQLSEFKQEVFYYQPDSWLNTYLDTTNFIILKDKTKVYKLKPGNNTGQQAANAKTNLITKFTKYNTLLNDNVTLGSKSKYTISGKEFSNPVKNLLELQKSKDPLTLPDWLEIKIKPEDVDYFATYQQQNKTAAFKADSVEVTNFTAKLFGEITKDNTNSTGFTAQYFKFQGSTPVDSFIDRAEKMEKQLLGIKETILQQLTDALNEKLKDKGVNGLGFIPTIRNVLAVFFANGEAYLRLMDDVHRAAWDQRESPSRVSSILGSSTSSDKKIMPSENKIVYPWPQLIKETIKDGQTSYEITYPGDTSVVSETQGYDYTIWPEVEFVEELIRAYIQRGDDISPSQLSSNEVSAIKRVSLNAIEFPITNQIYINKEEVKFFYEIWERLGFVVNYSRLGRGNSNSNSIYSLISDAENKNLVNALNKTNVFLIKKFKEYGISSANIIGTLRQISNSGEGESWQKYIRGYYSTPYIRDFTKNDFSIEDNPIFITLNDENQSSEKLDEEAKLVDYINGSSTNEFTLCDTFPFTNSDWVKTNLSDGVNNGGPKNSNATNKVIKFNTQRNVISNFEVTDTNKSKRPITHFNYVGSNQPTFQTNVNTSSLKSFYDLRVDNKKRQLVTEGGLYYFNYSGEVTANQTTSILNTPYFINSIQEGVQKFRDFNDYPYVSSAYLFLNSLPLTTLKEKYKTLDGGNELSLDYMCATLKKFGAIHRIPYAWILKYGSIWYRYKKKVETGVDILDGIWKDFNYLENYDPAKSGDTTTYTFTGLGETNSSTITLQDTLNSGQGDYTIINSGFYPKLINDFSVFFNGYNIFTTSASGTGFFSSSTIGFTSDDIQNGINSGLTVTKTSNVLLPKGFDEANTGRTMSISSWSSTLMNQDNTGYFPIPSFGNNFNQTLNECFKDVNSTLDTAKLKKEVTNNASMYNGSVRLFWSSPNYGYFDNSRLIKPDTTEYLKKIFSDKADTIQDNFAIYGEDSYSDISELLSTFKKEILDQFEQLFLKFALSKYDFQPIDPTKTTPGVSDGNLVYQNFQLLLIDMMKISSTGNTGVSLSETQQKQFTQINSKIESFINYDILFKYGNPSEYSKELFLSFTNANNRTYGYNSIFEPIQYNSYYSYSPNALPTSGNAMTLVQSKISYPDAWKALETYVGFSNISNIKYTDSGSTIFDFFIDNDVEFNEINVKTLYPLIKIYATKKSEDNTYNKTLFRNSINDYVNGNNDLQNLVMNDLVTKLQKSLPDVNNTPVRGVSTEVIGKQSKVEMWESLKATNDKWIAGADLTYKTIFEDVLLLDRASRDLGNKVIVDVLKLNDMITTMNVDSNLLLYVQSILQMNNFQIMALPSYVNFYNVQDPIKNPIPKLEGSLEFANDLFGTHTTVDYRNSGPKLVCLYAGKPSEHLAVNNTDYRFKDDGLDLSKITPQPLIEDQKNKSDWALSNRVVGFNVDMGTTNQNIFSNIGVSQDAGKSTSESLAVLNSMANNATGRGSETQNNSLYNLYKTRSYGCSVTMLGNAMIQPTMYFNLRHIPMFSGSYMILDVNHTITPGNFTTTFSGVRQPIYSLPKLDSYVQSIRENLLKSIITKVKQDKDNKKAASANTPNQQAAQNSQNSNELKPTANQECSLNAPFAKFENVSNPKLTTTSFRNAITTITASTASLDVKINRDKMNYALWSLIWLYGSTQDNTGFKGYEYNYANVRLNYKVSNQEINYGTNGSNLQKKYFCMSNSQNEWSYATYSNFEDLLSFLTAFLGQRVNTIKASKVNGSFNVNDDELATQITKFLFDYWPKKGDVYEKQKNTDEVKSVKESIKQSIIMAKSLGL